MPGIADRGGGPSLNKYSCTPEQLDRVTQIVGGDGSAASSICSTVNVGEIGETAAALQWLVKQVRLGEERASQIETVSSEAKWLSPWARLMRPMAWPS